MIEVVFAADAFAEYTSWLDGDRKTVKRINRLIESISRTPFEGIGKPEPLRGDFAGKWSRRIDEANRLVYSYEGGQVKIYQCRGHYQHG